jgi:uncharacterized membrane protein
MAATRIVTAWFSAAVVGVLVLYPVLVYVGISRLGPSAVAVLLIAVCLLRLLVLRIRGDRTLAARQTALITAGGILLATASLVFGKPNAMLYYPVLVNASLCLLFSWTLISPPSAIERLARLREPDLSAAGVRYTRRVTIAWVIFFVGNGAVALYTATLTPLATWALYNGFIAYLLIGTMFGAEFLVRSVVLRGRS